VVKEIRRYQASWGAWYVQVAMPWGVVELKFAKEPDAKVLDAAVSKLVEPVPVKEEQREVITIDRAIEFLQTEYVKAVEVVEKTPEQEVLVSFMATKEAAEPIVKEPILAVK
jgi:hypothetical protein